MMLPLVVGGIRTTAARSLWRRRHRAIALFIGGYLGAWLIAGVGISTLQHALPTLHSLPAQLVPAVGFLLATTWQTTATKWRAFSACHRTMPLAPLGWQADRDCLRFGWRTGGSCVASCWALMLACAFAGHAFAPLLAVTVLLALERLTPPGQHKNASVYALAGVTFTYVLVLA